MIIEFRSFCIFTIIIIAKSLKEILFALYILSGLVKAVFLMYNYEASFDITPVIALLLFILILVMLDLLRLAFINQTSLFQLL